MSDTYFPVPLYNTYWVLPGRLLAGEYPGDKSATVARQRILAMLAAGIDCFINLTTPLDRMEPYAALLAELWNTCPKSARYPDSPQIPEQRAFVAAWPLGRR